MDQNYRLTANPEPTALTCVLRAHIEAVAQIPRVGWPSEQTRTFAAQELLHIDLAEVTKLKTLHSCAVSPPALFQCSPEKQKTFIASSAAQQG